MTIKKISKERLEDTLARGENLSKLTNTTKNWLRQNIVKDNNIKPVNKLEKAADKLIATKSKGLINWFKNNPIETALLFTGGPGLARGAVNYVRKKYGKEVIKKVKEKLLIEYKKKSPPKGNINKAKTDSTIFQSSGQKRIGFNKSRESVITKPKIKKYKKPESNEIKKPVVDKTKVDTTNQKTFKRIKEIEKERATPEYTAKMTKIKKEQEKTFARNEKRRRDKITAKRNQTIKNKKEDEAKKLAKTQTGPKLNQVQKLYKQFKNNPKGINNAIDKLDMNSAAKSKLRQEVQSYKPTLKEKSELGLKKGGLIKRNMGGNLKQPPAGNKGLRKLPTPVRNKMGFAKRGGVVKKSTGGFLGAGKALRGQGAVMKKRGGKIGY